MTTFTFSTDNVAVANKIMAIINNTDTVVRETVVTETPATTAADDDITTADIQGIINTLADMDADDLADRFDGADKPYRVMKAFSFKDIANKIDYDPVAIDSSIDDVKKAIDLIIKDVSEGGLRHDDFERMFGVRTSKKLFKQNTLDEIVSTLMDYNII